MTVVDETGTGDPAGFDAGAPTDAPPEPQPRDDAPVRRAIDLAVVAACAGFVFWQLHPELLLADTTPAGGDMGAHVWAFGYLRDVLIPDGRLSGWTPDWYAGFPVFHFYMVVPFVAMVLLNAGVAGVASIAPVLASLALSARIVGVRSARLLAFGAAVGAVAIGLVGLFAGFGPGLRFVLAAMAVAAAVAAGRAGAVRHRGWLAAAAVLVAVVGVSLPYGTSFKLVSVAGVVAMPVSAFLFGRLARFPFPTPALLSVATVAFLFDKNFTIYGGNIASTMAGEFAFSISLALAIAYLGVVVHGLRTGTHRATAAVLLALVGLCHLIPAFFALGVTAVLFAVHAVSERRGAGPDHARRGRGWLASTTLVVVVAAGALAAGFAGAGPVLAVAGVALLVVGILWWTHPGPAAADEVADDGAAGLHPDDRADDGWADDWAAIDPRADPAAAPPPTGPLGIARMWWLLSAGAAGGLLAAWWVLPFYWQRTYLNDMGWEKIAVHADGEGLWTWFTDEVWPELVPEDLVVFGALALIGAVISVAFRHRIGSAMVITGLALALAFVYAPQGRLWNARLLPFWYLVVYFLAAIGVGEVVRALAQVLSGRPDRSLRALRWAGAPIALVVLAVHLGGQLHNLPFGRAVAATESAPASYELFAPLPDAISPKVTGRNFVTDWSRWNYSGYERKDAYPEYREIVTTMATVGEERGCGMSLWEYSPDLNDYGTPMALMLLPHWTDGCIGSMEGLYFEASSTTPFHFLVQSELSADPSRAQRDLPYRELDVDAGVEHLQLLGVQYYLARSGEAVAQASTHPDLTEVATSGPWVVYEVSGSAMVEPLAFEPAVTTGTEAQHDWLCAREDDTGRCSGTALDWFQDPSRWDVALAADGPEEWQRVGIDDRPDRRPLTPAAVDDIVVDREGISFTVDRPGTPVLVKQSYFPNWEANGADGPYRVAPNLMLVVPTDTEVSLTYGRTAIDWLAILLSLGGLAVLVWLARSGAVALPPLRRPAPAGPVPDDPTSGDWAPDDPAPEDWAPEAWAPEEPVTGSG